MYCIYAVYIRVYVYMCEYKSRHLLPTLRCLLWALCSCTSLPPFSLNILYAIKPGLESDDASQVSFTWIPSHLEPQQLSHLDRLSILACSPGRSWHWVVAECNASEECSRRRRRCRLCWSGKLEGGWIQRWCPRTSNVVAGSRKYGTCPLKCLVSTSIIFHIETGTPCQRVTEAYWHRWFHFASDDYAKCFLTWMFWNTFWLLSAAEWLNDPYSGAPPFCTMASNESSVRVTVNRISGDSQSCIAEQRETVGALKAGQSLHSFDRRECKGLLHQFALKCTSITSQFIRMSFGMFWIFECSFECSFDLFWSLST